VRLALGPAYFAGIGIFLLLISLYGFAGVIQAAMLFTGVRAMLNANLWGSVWIVALVSAVVAFALAWRGYRGSLPMAPPWVFRVSGIASLFLSAWLCWHFIAEASALDACLDHGGSFDYVAGSCDHETTHPSVSFFGRHGFRVVAVVLLTGGGILALRRKTGVESRGANSAL
jgi:hypothetical protein